APGMDSLPGNVQRPHPQQAPVPPPPLGPPRLPPPHPYWGPMHAIRGPMPPTGPPLPPPQFMPPPGRQRELIGVPTIDNNLRHNQSLSNRTVIEPNISQPMGRGMRKTRTKDKYRVVYSDHQRLELEKEFHYSRYITIRRKSELASMLGLSERQVKIWFQ
ncbi:unnamed protein product, partial [Sphagnum jensenii]